MKELINKLKFEYKRQIERKATEEDIKMHIIHDIYLKEMGFDLYECKYEENSFSGRQDIVTGIGSDVLTVETKKPQHNIEYKDVEQVVRYLINKGREWGLITNGKEYVLLNATIKTNSSDESRALLDKVVFRFDVSRSKGKEITNHKFFGYLSKKALFDTKVTSYFMYIQQFKVLNNPKGWNQYQSTLYAFFDYLVDDGISFTGKNSLEAISQRDFDSFIRFKASCNKSNKLSKETVNNNWSHISSMLGTLKSEGYISHSAFDIPRNLNYTKDDTQRQKDVIYVTVDNIKTIIAMYAGKRESARNIAAFLLCLLYGFERSEVNDLKWNQVDLINETITINERTLKCTSLLLDCFKEMAKEKKREKNKLSYVFCTKPREKWESFKDTTLNDIFNKIEMCGNEEYWKLFSPKYVKNCAIKLYHEWGYSLDEIVYLTGIEVKNLEAYISTSDIINSYNAHRKKERILFEGIFDTRLEDW